MYMVEQLITHVTVRIQRKKKNSGRGGIRTHAIEMTGALNQRLRPLGHATTCCGKVVTQHIFS